MMNNTPLKKIRVRVKRRNDNAEADNFVTVVIRGHKDFTQGVSIVAAEGYELMETQDRHEPPGHR